MRHLTPYNLIVWGLLLVSLGVNTRMMLDNRQLIAERKAAQVDFDTAQVEHDIPGMYAAHDRMVTVLNVFRRNNRWAIANLILVAGLCLTTLYRVGVFDALRRRLGHG